MSLSTEKVEEVEVTEQVEEKYVFPKDNAEPSICIPRVFTNTTRKHIFEVFSELKLGKIDRIDMVHKTNKENEEYFRVFIHFASWNKHNDTAISVRKKLLAGNEVKIVHQDPWFWKCSASKLDKPKDKFDYKPHVLL